MKERKKKIKKEAEKRKKKYFSMTMFPTRRKN